MAKQSINVGTLANDKTGDALRNAFIKVNNNFTELYDGGGGGTADLGSFKIEGNTLGTSDEGNSWGGSDMNLSPNGEGATWIYIPNDGNASQGAALVIGNTSNTGGGIQLLTDDGTWTFRNDGDLTLPGDITTGTVGGRFIQDCDDGVTSMRWINLSQGSNNVQLIRAYTGDPDQDTDVERAQIKLNWDGEENSEVQSGLTIRSFDHTDPNSQVDYNWRFGGNGTLELPAGAIIAETTITNNPTIVIAPAMATVESQVLFIKGGGNYTSGDNGIFLNWYIINPQVGDSVEINVSLVDGANQTLYWWIHPTDASISEDSPGTVVLNESGGGSFSFTVDNADYEFTVRVSPTDNVYDSATTGVETQVFNSEAPSFADHHLHLTTGDLTETSIILGTDNHNLRTRQDGGVEINTSLYNSENRYKWEFDNNGSLTLPSGGQIGFYGMGWTGFTNGNTGTPLSISYNSSTQQQSFNGLSEILLSGTDSTGSVFIYTNNLDLDNSHTWSFDQDGTTTLPGAVVHNTLTTAGTDPNINDPIFAVTQVDVNGAVTEITVTNSPNLVWTTGISGQVFNDVFYTVSIDGGGNATVVVDNGGTGHNTSETFTLSVEELGGTPPTPIAIDLSKSINKLADGYYTLADGVEGQVMHLVRQTGNYNNFRVYVTNVSRSNGSEYTNNYFDDIDDVATLIYTDDAWQASGVYWD